MSGCQAPPPHVTVGGWVENPKSGFALSYAVTSPNSEIQRGWMGGNSEFRIPNSELGGWLGYHSPPTSCEVIEGGVS